MVLALLHSHSASHPLVPAHATKATWVHGDAFTARRIFSKTVTTEEPHASGVANVRRMHASEVRQDGLCRQRGPAHAAVNMIASKVHETSHV
jgi:hypothetical protein